MNHKVQKADQKHNKKSYKSVIKQLSRSAGRMKKNVYRALRPHLPLTF